MPYCNSIEDLEHLSIDLADLEGKRNLMGGALLSLGLRATLPEGTFSVGPVPPIRRLLLRDEPGERGGARPAGSASEGPVLRISLTATRDMIERGLPVFAEALE